MKNLETMFEGRRERNATRRHSSCEAPILMGTDVPKPDNAAGQCAMPDTDRPGKIIDGEILTSSCVDLVPLTPQVQWLRRLIVTRPDSTFITQLIATAEQPQTCNLRRAIYADAQMAYGPHPQERRGVARRTRQII
jgi:hypothetical protein